MVEQTSLGSYLRDWAGDETRRIAITRTVECIARAAAQVAKHIARSPFAGLSGHPAVAGPHILAGLDVTARTQFQQALGDAPVALLALPTGEGVLSLDRYARLAVALQPLDAGMLLELDVPAGTLFSIYPLVDGPAGDAFRQPGHQQLAAGLVIYGPYTALVLSTGDGVSVCTLDDESGGFRVTRTDVTILAGTREYAIDASRQRCWDDQVRHYVDERNGMDQPGYGMRWTGSLVAEAYRIVTRGGVCLCPPQMPGRVEHGGVALLFAAQPIAFIIEQAGGAASDGVRRVLDIVPAELEQRIGLFFGAPDEVERVTHYYGHPESFKSRSPLFRRRDLFRS